MLSPLFLVAGLVAAPCPAGDLRRAHIVRVLDGDTIVADLDMGLGMTMAAPLRFAGVDTPELGAKDPAIRAAAVRAREYVARQVNLSPDFTVCIGKRDDFGRVLATVYVGGVSLNQALLEQGLAVPFKK